MAALGEPVPQSKSTLGTVAVTSPARATEICWLGKAWRVEATRVGVVGGCRGYVYVGVKSVVSITSGSAAGGGGGTTGYDFGRVRPRNRQVRDARRDLKPSVSLSASAGGAAGRPRSRVPPAGVHFPPL